uniref:G_PROTEIN_RECEP_F1_2 domain-containing protein n=1 Tax=Parastrongyloides trichosuri TaxID=131310 RepID=A0A0N4ZM47_PARTI
MNGLEIFHWIYSIPSYILYLLFTLMLAYKVIKKEITLENTFYILIFWKCIIDILLQVTILFFTGTIKFSYMKPFFEENNWVCAIFYLLSTFCYTATFEITTVMSINRFVAIKYPLKYEKIFTSKNLFLLFLITLATSSFIGIYSYTFECKYFIDTKQSYVSYTTDSGAYFVSSYTLGFYLPLIVISSVINGLTIKKFRVMTKNSVVDTKADNNLLIYSITSFLGLFLFFIFYFLKAISVYVARDNLTYLTSIAIPFAIDIETFGLFYISLITKYVFFYLFIC